MHLLFVSLLTSISAAGCPEPADADVRKRVEALNSVIEDHTPAMTVWWNGYIAIHAGSAAGLGAVIHRQEGSSRNESLLGMFSSSLGVLTLIANPPAIFEAEARLGRLDLDTDQGRRHYLQLAEEMLARQSRQTRFATSWVSRAVAGAYALGSGLFSWRVLDRGRRAIRNVVVGVAIGQSRISLHPTGAADAWAAYKHQYLTDCGRTVTRWRPPAPAAVQWHLGTARAGLGLTLSF